MNKRIERCTLAAAMAVGTMALAGFLTAAQAALPAVQHQGSVEYVSGGIGLDRLEAAVKGLFPLPQVPAGEILTNARQAGAVDRAMESLRAALDALDQGLTPDVVLTEMETAMEALGELTGRGVRRDELGSADEIDALIGESNHMKCLLD